MIVCILMVPALLLLLLYAMFRLVFVHPLKKRPNPYQIPESDLYRMHKDKMMRTLKEMDEESYEEVYISSEDGYKLWGRLYLWKESAPLMIAFHGYRGVYGWDGYGYFKICKNNGMNILLVDERAHGKSESSTITFGIKERFDCKLWIEYAMKRLGSDKDIILAGVSMGAAAVLMASELNLPQNVKAIVADCPYTEPREVIKETIKKLKLPAEPVYKLLKVAVGIFGHFDLEGASPLEAVKRAKIPMLFIQGEKDSVVPMDMGQILYENCASEKGRAVFPEADHANSAMTDFSAYEKAVLNFLENIHK